MEEKTIAVKVAVRARPLSSREIEDGCRNCLEFDLPSGIYEERVVDLLCDKNNEKVDLPIREHPTLGIFVQDLSQNIVNDFTQTLKCLEQGCTVRTKGETAMNSKSSRSHAIFTLIIHKTSKYDASDSCCAKLNLVDLAGSERLKKTQAEGKRKNEGIKINEGLLALGNVISALTDVSQQRSHVPYRDSKLTRLLQDSLGGNSHTIMIACVSPADSNHDETLNTLRYAERAKKIKNKPTVNLDPNANEVIQLRRELQDLRRQLLQVNSGEETYSSSKNSRELDEVKRENEELKNEKIKLSSEITHLVAAQASLIEKIAMVECQRDKFKEKIESLKTMLSANVTELEASQFSIDDEERQKQLGLIKDLHQQLNVLQNDVQEHSFADEITEHFCRNDAADDEEEDDFDEDKFRHRQVAATKKMEDLLQQIRQKEELVQGAASTNEQMERLKATHEKETAELLEKIDSLQTERRELETKVQNVDKTSKISETRRKRLQELEKQLSEYKKKLADAQKMEKLKQQSDQNVRKLREEIVALKQTRVQLVRQLRNDNQRFREWQSRTEKQVNQLKMKEKKREFENQKAKRAFDQQLSVHRRKYEEAVAFTKRLQSQLQRQTAVKNEKFNDAQENDRLIKDVKNFIDAEVELVVSTEQAKLFCENLIQQRKELTKQLHKAERKLAREDEREIPIKKKNIGDGKSLDSFEEQSLDKRTELKNEIETFKQEISLRNVEIQELQRRISAFDSDAADERRWANVHTLVYARCALKTLFSLATSSRVDCLQVENQLNDVKTQYDVIGDTVKQQQQLAVEERQKFDEEICKLRGNVVDLERQQNQKVSFLLGQLYKLAFSGQLDEEMKKILELHCEEARKMQLLSEQLEQMNEEKVKLTKELSKAKVRGTKTSGQFFRNVTSNKRLSEENTTDADVFGQRIKRNRSSRTRVIQSPVRLAGTVLMEEVDDSGENDSESDRREDDDAKDSDYRETPLHKRKTFTVQRETSNEILRRKRMTTEPTICKCRRGACTNLTCGCVKRKSGCNENCKCVMEQCKNRNSIGSGESTPVGEVKIVVER